MSFEQLKELKRLLGIFKIVSSPGMQLRHNIEDLESILDTEISHTVVKGTYNHKRQSNE